MHAGTEAVEEGSTYFRERTSCEEPEPLREQHGANYAYTTAGTAPMLTVLNSDGRGSRAHAPEAMHTPGLAFTGGDNATHTGVGGRDLLGPCALAEDFFSWESGCVCIFFSSHWLPRQRVRACVCVCV